MILFLRLPNADKHHLWSSSTSVKIIHWLQLQPCEVHTNNTAVALIIAVIKLVELPFM